MRAVDTHQLEPGVALPAEVYESAVPVLLPGYLAGWPVVQAAQTSPEAVADYLTQYDSQQPVTVFAGSKEMQGRFFYNENFTGFNFRSGRAVLGQVLARLLAPERSDDIETLYVGSTPVDQWLPGFRAQNDVQLPMVDALASFWLGNATTISAHFDYPDNLACVVAGRRRFRLFPPDQLENLYVGPLDRTPAGQPISLVDMRDPDFQRFPKFKAALDVAQYADLESGDALFLPSMWWHHVVASDPFNLLVNYWWTQTPSPLAGPSDALNHAIVTIRNMPERQRMAWKHLFDHYVFQPDPKGTEHIPAGARGILGPLEAEDVQRVRNDLVNKLS